jgi:hypothetical protein
VGFKSDREFLRNISIGAVGTQQVVSLLNAGGFQFIELERYCTCNQIWATKIKRLRVPDLLCLKTGIQLECRAKSVLKLTMSHAVNNAERAWDKGLRDDDLVAFIQCTPHDDIWHAADRVNLFRVRDMRRQAHLAGLGRMKAASEGSEIQLTWPATVPTAAGRIEAVSPERIVALLNSGRRQTYQLRRKEFTLSAHAKPGDAFGAGDTIIASALPTLVEPIVPAQPHYDFVADLDSDDIATVYAAVKALGFLPERGKRTAQKLESIARVTTRAAATESARQTHCAKARVDCSGRRGCTNSVGSRGFVSAAWQRSGVAIFGRGGARRRRHARASDGGCAHPGRIADRGCSRFARRARWYEKQPR